LSERVRHLTNLLPSSGRASPLDYREKVRHHTPPDLLRRPANVILINFTLYARIENECSEGIGLVCEADSVDKQIIRFLQEGGRKSNVETVCQIVVAEATVRKRIELYD